MLLGPKISFINIKVKRSNAASVACPSVIANSHSSEEQLGRYFLDGSKFPCVMSAGMCPRFSCVYNAV